MDYQTLVKSCLDIVAKLFKFNVNNLIWHTDNGIQYCCYQFTKFYNIKTSRSKPGVATDNGFAENFFSHLSAEWIKNKIYTNKIIAINDIEEYISFYNHERIIMKFKNNPWKNLIFKEN